MKKPRRIVDWLFDRYLRCNLVVWDGPKPAFPAFPEVDDITLLDITFLDGRPRQCFLWRNHAGQCMPPPLGRS